MQVCYERPRFMIHHSSSLHIVSGKKSTCSKRIAKTGDGRCLKPVNSIRIDSNSVTVTKGDSKNDNESDIDSK